MKKWVRVGFAGVVLLWILGAWWLLPTVQSKLEQATVSELAKPEYTGAFDEVTVSFSGQEATLTGRVASQQEHEQVGRIVAENVRVTDAPGASLNPVTSVINHVGVEYGLARQKPKPWLLVAHLGHAATLAGIVPAPLKEQATQTLTARLAGATLSNLINLHLATDAKPRPAEDASGTFDAKNLPAFADNEIAATTLKGQWFTFKSTSTDIEISDALASADVQSGDVIEALAPLRAAQAVELEKARQASLPPAYAAVVVLPDYLHAYGTVGDGDSQRRLLTTLGLSYPKRKMLTNAIKVSNDIHGDAEWNSAVSALPRTDGSAFVAALPAGGKPAIWDGKGDVEAMKKALGNALPPTFDFKELFSTYDNWVQVKNAPPPPASIAPPAAAPISITPANPVPMPAPTAPPAISKPPAQTVPVNPTPTPAQMSQPPASLPALQAPPPLVPVAPSPGAPVTTPPAAAPAAPSPAPTAPPP